MRPSRRQADELRAITLDRGVVKHAEGSCFVKFGDTHVLVTATLEERLPPNFTKHEPSACFTTPRSSVTARSSSGCRRLGRIGFLNVGFDGSALLLRSVPQDHKA